MAPRTRSAATRPPPAAVPAPRPPLPPPAARRRRPGLPAPPGRAASGRPEEELQDGSGADATPGSSTERPGGIPAQHGLRWKRRGKLARDGSPPARKARARPAAVSLSTSASVRSPVLRKVNRPITRSISRSAQANAAVANEDTNTTDMRTRTDDIESLRRRLLVAESKVAKEEDNVRRGLEKIRRNDALLNEIRKRHIGHLERALHVIGDLRDEIDALEKVKAEKEAEIQELKMQTQAEVLKVKVLKEAEVLEVIKENIRLLRIVDKKEAQLQAMSEHCKLLALKHN